MEKLLSVQDRIVHQAKQLGLRQVDIIKATGAPKATVSNWFSGNGKPSSKYLVSLSLCLKKSPDWILFGKESKTPASLTALILPEDSTSFPDKDCVAIPHITTVDIGRYVGSGFTEAPGDERLLVAKETLVRCGISPETAISIRISGNSMEPRLFDGDIVGINTDDGEIIDGKTYALNHNGLLRIRRLYRTPSGLRMNAINTEEYPDEIYKGEDVLKISVIGRVAWHFSTWN